MAVIHILKDGTQVSDISGHTISRQDAPSIYVLIDRINTKESRGINHEKKAE